MIKGPKWTNTGLGAPLPPLMGATLSPWGTGESTLGQWRVLATCQDQVFVAFKPVGGDTSAILY